VPDWRGLIGTQHNKHNGIGASRVAPSGIRDGAVEFRWGRPVCGGHIIRVCCTPRASPATRRIVSGVMEVTNMTTKGRLGRDGYLWTTADLRKLKRLAKDRAAVTEVAKVLGRTPAAVQQKAMRSGIAFRR
jgi:hypothetical protein